MTTPEARHEETRPAAEASGPDTLLDEIRLSVEQLLRDVLPRKCLPGAPRKRNLQWNEVGAVERASSMTVVADKPRSWEKNKKHKISSESYEAVAKSLVNQAMLQPEAAFIHDYRVLACHREQVQQTLATLMEELDPGTVARVRQAVRGVLTEKRNAFATHDLEQVRSHFHLKGSDFVFPQLPLRSAPRRFSHNEIVVMLLESAVGRGRTFREPREVITRELVQKGLHRKPCENGVGRWRSMLLQLLEKLDVEYESLSDKCIERLFAACRREQGNHATSFAQRLHNPSFEGRLLSHMKMIIEHSDPNHRYSQEDLDRAMAVIRVGPSCAPPM